MEIALLLLLLGQRVAQLRGKVKVIGAELPGTSRQAVAEELRRGVVVVGARRGGGGGLAGRDSEIAGVGRVDAEQCVRQGLLRLLRGVVVLLYLRGLHGDRV